MLEAWLFRAMIWALSCRSVIRVKQHPLCWDPLNPTMRRARFLVSASPVTLAHCWSYVGVYWCLLIISIFSRAFLR
jgi:hypothetical protein